MKFIPNNLLKSLKLRHVVISLIALGGINYLWDSFVEVKIPHIARIRINGQIEDNNSKLIEAIRQVGNDNAAKALIISISSPGGTVYGSEAIHNAILAVRKHKPVIAEVLDTAASGAYQIACACNSIVASNSSLVGSIGVLSVFPQVKPLLDKLGISFITIKSSPMKAEPLPFNAPNEEAITMMRKLVLDYYHSFVQTIAKCRNMPYEKVLRLANGSIWSGSQAKKLGLVDIIGGEEAIIESLRSSWKVDKSIRKIKDRTPYNYKTRFIESFVSEMIFGDVLPFIKNQSHGRLLAMWYHP
ncbi:MAG: signal peptide peptidase SppA [Candidatus Liberibacter europaeus]|uniref:Signal peptide peptidase SppA n=1 Tax=Candidatus Liberibacter europaeus TaxID=744859 RepID=A0A2T4VZ54_9HYPH|nr:signal peptide peptidase SppA [Candidatus Liberibacter europaeus]PTL87060.1 MAG: signal peptide peptidase SppA [Candidatus Liberibacter europaeus]